MRTTLPKGCRLLAIGSEDHHAFVKDAEEHIAREIPRCISDFSNQNRGIFPVTKFLAIGKEEGHPSTRDWYGDLSKQGVTDVIRLRSEGFRRSIFSLLKSFPTVHHHPIKPAIPIEAATIRSVLYAIHQILHGSQDPRLLLHCWKGEDRSPTALWMYLVAIGLSQPMADKLITTAYYEAKPAEKPLVWREEASSMAPIRDMGRSLRAVRSDLFETLYPFPWLDSRTSK